MVEHDAEHLDNTTSLPRDAADVVIVGAGPAGSAAGYFLAQLGYDVVIIEKATFPRDKICGDGLTPRAVHALKLLGMHDESEGITDGWARQRGLRMYGGGVTWNLPWPETDHFPSHSVTATRMVLDHALAKNAEAAGATLVTGTRAIEPVYSDPSHERVAGIVMKGSDGRKRIVEGRQIVLADGVSSRISVAMGLHRDKQRPMGTAVRAYYRSPRSTMDHMEGFLEMRNPDGELLPGYGWIFPLDDGLVNVGWGLISTSPHYQSTSYRDVLDDWVASFPDHWGITSDTKEGPTGGAGLPMAHSRHPHLYNGVVLIGDAGGMVNPFNGEGISYAIEAAEMAAEAIDVALQRNDERALEAYPARVAETWGGYYTLGRIFLTMMGNPSVMRFATQYGLPRRRLMGFVFRTMAHLINDDPKNATDVLINTLSRAVPKS